MCDLVYVLYGVGGVAMIFISYKLFGKGKKPKQKTDASPSTDHNDHSVSTE